MTDRRINRRHERSGAVPGTRREAWGQAVFEDSLLKRGPASPVARRRDPEELLDPAAFQERLREARARREIALATRAAAGGAGMPNPMRATPPVFPAPAGAFETEAPIFAPPFARQPGAPRPEPAAPPPPRAPHRPPARAPRIELTPDPRPAPPWARALALAAPFAHALRSRTRALGATRLAGYRAAPLVAGCCAAGLVFAAAGVMLFSGDAEPPPPRAAAADPAPAAVPAPPPAAPAPAEAPPAAPAALAVPASDPPASTPQASEPLAPEPPEPETLAAPEPDQMPSPEPDALPAPAPLPPALAGEYLTARPLPRPATIRPAEAATPAPAAAHAGTRVVINVPAGKAAENPDAAEAVILAAGFPVVEQARVRVDMTRNQVRYFHAADAPSARALADLTGAIARDFTTHTPPPKRGYLELWLAGTAPRHAAPAPAAEDQILGILRGRAAKN